MASENGDAELRLLLVGNAGAGKSATGNSILMKLDYFDESDGAISVPFIPKTCSGDPLGNGKRIAVTDTPDISETWLDGKSIEGKRFIAEVSPGPHAILLVISVKRRISREVESKINLLRKMFGKKCTTNMIIVFTHTDQLFKSAQRREPIELDDYVKDVKSKSEYMNSLLVACNGRYVGFNNDINFMKSVDKEQAAKEQLQHLMMVIEQMLQTNDGQYYPIKYLVERGDSVLVRLMNKYATVTYFSVLFVGTLATGIGLYPDHHDDYPVSNLLRIGLITTGCSVSAVAFKMFRNGKTEDRKTPKHLISKNKCLTVVSGLSYGFLSAFAISRGYELPAIGLGGLIVMIELRIILLGNTGAGKSATGNSILMDEVFFENDDPVAGSRHSVTHNGDPFQSGRVISITDTPGFHSTNMSNEMIGKHVFQFLSQISPGPHAIVIVVSTKSRVSQEIHKAVMAFCDMFGEESRAHMVFVFTNIDTLKRSRSQPPTPIKVWMDNLASQNMEMKKLIVQECRERYVGFNNVLDFDAEEHKAQVQALLDVIMTMLRQNGNKYFTCPDIQEVEKIMLKMDDKTGSRAESRDRVKDLILAGAACGALAQTATGLSAGAAAIDIVSDAAFGAGVGMGATASGVIVVGAIAGITVGAWKLFKQMKVAIFGDVETAIENFKLSSSTS